MAPTLSIDAPTDWETADRWVVDPRWFALQKMWMSAQTKRNPLKRPKDLRQAQVVWAAVATSMPHYPLDELDIPRELRAAADALHTALAASRQAAGRSRI